MKNDWEKVMNLGDYTEIQEKPFKKFHIKCCHPPEIAVKTFHSEKFVESDNADGYQGDAREGLLHSYT